MIHIYSDTLYRSLYCRDLSYFIFLLPLNMLLYPTLYSRSFPARISNTFHLDPGYHLIIISFQITLTRQLQTFPLLSPLNLIFNLLYSITHSMLQNQAFSLAHNYSLYPLSIQFILHQSTLQTICFHSNLVNFSISILFAIHFHHHLLLYFYSLIIFVALDINQVSIFFNGFQHQIKF